MSFLKGTEPAEIAASLRELADTIEKGKFYTTMVMVSQEQDRYRIEIKIEGYRASRLELR